MVLSPRLPTLPVSSPFPASPLETLPLLLPLLLTCHPPQQVWSLPPIRAPSGSQTTTQCAPPPSCPCQVWSLPPIGAPPRQPDHHPVRTPPPPSSSLLLLPHQVWSLPPIGAPPGSQTTTQAQLRVSLEDANPVRTLLPIGRGRYSGGSTTSGPGALLALGGGPEEEPDGLALLPLPYPGGGGGEEEGEEAADEREVVRLRWVGHVLGLALVPPPGAIGCGEWRGGRVQ